MQDYHDLASYKRCIYGIDENWASFSERLKDRLRRGHETEPVAESIIEDLFTRVLDWRVGDLERQQGKSDIILSRNGIKYLLIEAKRPKTLRRQRKPLERALEQARGYAAKQRVGRIAATDGYLFYAGDLRGGGLVGRILVDLSDNTPPRDLWWISVDGIHREPSPLPLPAGEAGSEGGAEGLLHPRYKLPARCFAYVRDEAKPRTWKYPYRKIDGEADEKRLPAAIRAATSNYRGVRSDLPDDAAPFVIARFVEAAKEIGRYDSSLKSYTDLRAAAAQYKMDVGRIGEMHRPQSRPGDDRKFTWKNGDLEITESGDRPAFAEKETPPTNSPTRDQRVRSDEEPFAAGQHPGEEPEPGVASLSSPQRDTAAIDGPPGGLFARLRRALWRRRRTI